MAIQIQPEKRTNFTPLIIVIFLLIIGAFLYLKYFRGGVIKEKEINYSPEILPPTSQEILKKGVDISSFSNRIKEVLEHPVFKSLISHINWPPESPQLGRPNPFKPL